MTAEDSKLPMLERSRIPHIQGDLDRLSIGTAREIHDLMSRIKISLTRLEAMLKSDLYPCPICASWTQDTDKIGLLKLCWDVEYDEYYPISSTPYVEGTCTDEPQAFGMIRGRSPFHLGETLPFNHAEQINQMMEDDSRCEEWGYILGAAQERRRLCEQLGIPVKRWG